MKERLIEWTRQSENKDVLNRYCIFVIIILTAILVLLSIFEPNNSSLFDFCTIIMVAFFLIKSIIEDLFKKDENTIRKNKFIIIVITGETFLATLGIVICAIISYKLGINLSTIKGIIIWLIIVCLVAKITKGISEFLSKKLK